MLVTEDEAKTKWCPFARVIVDREFAEESVASGNRWTGETLPTNSPTNSECLGPGCMAWRWQPRMEPAGDPFDISKSPGIARSAPPTHGYCGLARTST